MSNSGSSKKTEQNHQFRTQKYNLQVIRVTPSKYNLNASLLYNSYSKKCNKAQKQYKVQMEPFFKSVFLKKSFVTQYKN